MTHDWFIIHEGKERGPFTAQQLKDMAATGKLRPVDMVRREDMKGPTKATAVKGLFPADRPSSPPAAGAARSGAGPTSKIDKSVPVDDLRRRLTAFADKIPHHQIRSLGDSITVVAASRLPVFRVEWTALFERREVVQRQRPHDDSGAIPRRGFDPETFDVWRQALPKPTGFEASTAEVPLEATQQVHDCGQCGTAGAVTCDGCDGQQQVSCPNCKGSGVQACGGCLGTGRTVETYTERRQRHCQGPILAGVPSHCNGGFDKHGQVCSRCNGTGVEWYNHTGMRQAPCPACGAAGRVACSSCNATGIITCPRCQGHGSLTCLTCSGHGRVVHYLAVIRSFEPRASAVVVPTKECPQECVKGLDEQADFKDVLQQANLEGELDADLRDGMEHLTGDVQAVRDRLRKQATNTRRLAGERLRISRASVYRLDYTLDGKAFTAWFSGEDGLVHAPVNPLTDSVARLVKEAVAAWSEGRRRESEWTLRRALGMAKASPDCARALEPLKPRIPEELLRRASSFFLRFWFEHLSPVGKALVGVPAGCLSLFVLAFCFMCVIGIIVGPTKTQKDKQGTTENVAGQHQAPADQERLIAEVEAQAPPLPAFPEGEYKYDFSKDEYDTIPAGAKKHTQRRVIRSGAPELIGKPETTEGYIDSAGKFIEHGTFTTWTDDAEKTKLREGRMLNGKLHGVMTYYYPSGKKQSELPFVNDKKHGIGRSWYADGQLETEVGWERDKFHGRRRFWYETGPPEVDETYIHGDRHGLFKKWWKDGRLAFLGCFRNGKRHGKLFTWNEDGSPGESGEWEDGRPKGKCRLAFLGADKRYYFIEADDGDWKGGTKAEFIARMYYFSLKDRPDVELQFDPKLGIATYSSKDEGEFFTRFGKPSQDVADFEKAGGAPAFLRDRYRLWSYACRDGVLMLHVQPTQSGALLVTARP